ncbi:MAG: hypothetical protein AB1589_27265 [Cyanobacteriota bacterium]
MAVFLAFFGICCLIVLVYHLFGTWFMLFSTILLVLAILRWLWRIFD